MLIRSPIFTFELFELCSQLYKWASQLANKEPIQANVKDFEWDYRVRDAGFFAGRG
jgi:hypothetical protein